MKVLDITELEDGSANLNVEFTAEEINILLNKALVDILKENMEAQVGLFATDCNERQV